MWPSWKNEEWKIGQRRHRWQSNSEVKVLHLINTLSAGGAELHLLTLCRQLKRKGADTLVACLREHVKDSRSLRLDFENEGIRVVRLEADGRYNLRFVGKLARLVKKERPAILHTHLPRADLAGAFGRLHSPSVLWVSSVHDIHDKSWSGRWTLPLFNFIWPHADRVVAISHAVKDWLVKERSVPEEKVTVIHYGIEPERFSQSNRDLRATWNLDGNGIVGSLGRFERRKGHDCLIQAMAATLERNPNTLLLIGGHDPLGYSKNLQALIDRSRLNSHVRLVGVQNDIPAFLNALDVFAFASRSEGFGQVVIEAMAAGKPVVASKMPPMTEIVRDGETGLLVNPDDPQAFANAISWLLTYREQAQQMGKRGQERVYSHFSAQRMVDETLSLYSTLLNSSRCGLAAPPMGNRA
jgi:glycosyltransferase involved in cell wall biosynthesis